MSEKRIKFSKAYIKLTQPLFTTIRSVKYLEKYNIKINDIVMINIEGEDIFKAIVVGFYDMKIENMTSELLKYDTNAFNYCINNKEEFVDLLNSFIPKYNPNRLSTKKRLIFLLTMV